MPPPTSSLKPAAAAAPPKKATNGNGAAPAAAPTDGDSKKHVGKPDQAKYNAEQDTFNKQIADVKAKLDAIRSRISLSSAPKSEGDRRTVLKSEMESIRTEQQKYKSERQKTLDEMKRLQESVGKRIKEVQAKGGKGFRNVQEVDERIASLDKQVESGNMKLVDEKRALQEITTLRRARKQLETTGSVEDAIAADKTRIDELRKQLDDPESRKVSDRYDALKKEMDGLREEGNKAYEERGKLFDERNALSAEMDAIYGKKRESAQTFREENDQYWAKVQADRQARNERFRSEKAKEDAVRREEEIVRLREEAKMPAFAGEIDDCNVLIKWFQGKYGGEVPETNAGGKGQSNAGLQGVKELDIRKVDNQFEGMTLKKKGDDEEMGGFFGGGGKGKGKKGGNKGKGAGTGSGVATPKEGDEAVKDKGVNLPMSLLSALLSLGIPPPSTREDTQRTMDDLETKKAWFEANSKAKTEAEIERVEKLVAKMQKKNAVLAEGDAEEETGEGEKVESETGGAKEPMHTVAVAGAADGIDIVEDEGLQLPTDASPNDEVKHVDSALEEIKAADA